MRTHNHHALCDVFLCTSLLGNPHWKTLIASAAESPPLCGILASQFRLVLTDESWKSEEVVLPHRRHVEVRMYVSLLDEYFWRPTCFHRDCPAAASVLADTTQDRADVEREVLRYVVEHPTAADSAEGVRLWWLREMGVVSESLLRMVLDELLERGWLVTRGDRPENKIYSLNERERASVERYVNASRERSDG